MGNRSNRKAPQRSTFVIHDLLRSTVTYARDHRNAHTHFVFSGQKHKPVLLFYKFDTVHHFPCNTSSAPLPVHHVSPTNAICRVSCDVHRSLFILHNLIRAESMCRWTVIGETYGRYRRLWEYLQVDGIRVEQSGMDGYEKKRKVRVDEKARTQSSVIDSSSNSITHQWVGAVTPTRQREARE